MGPEGRKDVSSVPGSLEAALDRLEEDHEFLPRGDVFTQDVLDTRLWYRRTKEVGAVRLRPHPYKFVLCYDL